MNAAPAPAAPAPPMQSFPSGEAAPGYRWAFRAYSVMFLLTLCAGLANFVIPKIARLFG